MDASQKLRKTLVTSARASLGFVLARGKLDLRISRHRITKSSVTGLFDALPDFIFMELRHANKEISDKNNVFNQYFYFFRLN